MLFRSNDQLDLSAINNVAVTSALGLSLGDSVEIEFENVGSGSVVVYAGVFSSSSNSATTVAGAGVHKVVLPMGTDYDGIRFNSGAATGVLIDNVSVKQVLYPNQIGRASCRERV